MRSQFEMTEPKTEKPESTKQQPPRQVTVQPQEPVPWKGGPPKQPQHPDKQARPVREGDKDERSGKDRDGLK